MLNLFIVLSAMFFSMLFFGLAGWIIEAYCFKQERPDSPCKRSSANRAQSDTRNNQKGFIDRYRANKIHTERD